MNNSEIPNYKKETERIGECEDNSGSMPMIIDFEKYAKLLKGADPNDPDVKALIEILFSIQLQFSDLAWRCGSTQLACGQRPESGAICNFTANHMIESEDNNLTEKFDTNAKGTMA